MEDYIGYLVSLDCGYHGTFQGEVVRVHHNEDAIELMNVFQNGNLQRGNFKFRSDQIRDLQVLRKKPNPEPPTKIRHIGGDAMNDSDYVRRHGGFAGIRFFGRHPDELVRDADEARFNYYDAPYAGENSDEMRDQRGSPSRYADRRRVNSYSQPAGHYSPPNVGAGSNATGGPNRAKRVQCFEMPVSQMKKEFDFEGNLALFDKEAIFKELDDQMDNLAISESSDAGRSKNRRRNRSKTGGRSGSGEKTAASPPSGGGNAGASSAGRQSPSRPFKLSGAREQIMRELGRVSPRDLAAGVGGGGNGGGGGGGTGSGSTGKRCSPKSTSPKAALPKVTRPKETLPKATETTVPETSPKWTSPRSDWSPNEHSEQPETTDSRSVQTAASRRDGPDLLELPEALRHPVSPMGAWSEERRCSGDGAVLPTITGSQLNTLLEAALDQGRISVERLVDRCGSALRDYLATSLLGYERRQVVIICGTSLDFVQLCLVNLAHQLSCRDHQVSLVLPIDPDLDCDLQAVLVEELELFTASDCFLYQSLEKLPPAEAFDLVVLGTFSGRYLCPTEAGAEHDANTVVTWLQAGQQQFSKRILALECEPSCLGEVNGTELMCSMTNVGLCLPRKYHDVQGGFKAELICDLNLPASIFAEVLGLRYRSPFYRSSVVGTELAAAGTASPGSP